MPAALCPDVGDITAPDLIRRIDHELPVEAVRDGGGSQHEVRERVRQRLSDLDHKILHLTAIRSALATLEQQCTGCGPVSGCAIIEGVKSLSLP